MKTEKFIAVKQYIHNHEMKIYYLIFVILTLAGFIYTFHDGIQLYDYKGQWQLCAYEAHGLNPYDYIGSGAESIPQIGRIPEGWGTVPWSLVLGQFYYNGFLPWEYASTWAMIINIVIVIITSVVVFLDTQKKVGREAALCTALLCVFNLSYWGSVDDGNIGGIVCCFLIIACIIEDRYPIIAGICLCFAMIKPQVAFLFCIVMLLQRRFKVLIVGALGVIIAWTLASIQVKASPISLLLQFLASDTGANAKYIGMFTCINDAFPLGWDTQLMALSMLVGVILVIVFFKKWKSDENNLVAYLPAAMITVFWSYSFRNDKFTLFLPTMVFSYLLFKEAQPKKRFIYFIMVCYFSFEKYFSMATKLAIATILPDLTPDWHYARTVMAISYLLILLIMQRKSYLLNDNKHEGIKLCGEAT